MASFSLGAAVLALLVCCSYAMHNHLDRGVADGDTYVCADPINCCIQAIRCLRMMLYAADDDNDPEYHDQYMGQVHYSSIPTGVYSQVFASDSSEHDCPYPRCSRGFQPGAGESHPGQHQIDQSVDGYEEAKNETMGCWRWAPFTVGPDYHAQFHSLSECLSVDDGVGNYYTLTPTNTPPRAQHMMRHCTGPFLETHRKCISAWIDAQFLSKSAYGADNSYGTYSWDDVNSDALPMG